MHVGSNLVVLAIALVAAVVIGLVWRRANGHFRGAASHEAPTTDRMIVSTDDIGDALGERATLLQFSSAFCAPCRATRHILADVASIVPGVAHVEIDAEHRLELVRRLGVMRTPTTFVLDRSGAVITRASGAPTKDQVLRALSEAV